MHRQLKRGTCCQLERPLGPSGASWREGPLGARAAACSQPCAVLRLPTTTPTTAPPASALSSPGPAVSRKVRAAPTFQPRSPQHHSLVGPYLEWCSGRPPGVRQVEVSCSESRQRVVGWERAAGQLLHPPAQQSVEAAPLAADRLLPWLQLCDTRPAAGGTFTHPPVGAQCPGSVVAQRLPGAAGRRS